MTYELQQARVFSRGSVNYDSTQDTKDHISRVNSLMEKAAQNLIARGLVHDQSKLESPEKEYFDELTPKLRESTYGSPEYWGNIRALEPALKHHYSKNSHHPQFYENGVNGMDLFDIVEMFMDWKAAAERHADGDLVKSIQVNKERFNLSDQLVDIFNNTLKVFNDAE